MMADKGSDFLLIAGMIRHNKLIDDELKATEIARLERLADEARLELVEGPSSDE